MKKLIVATILSAVTAVAFSQDSGGVKIKGNTNINAAVGSQTAVAVGQDNTAKNTVGAIKGGTEIKGNTNINAVAGSQTAVAVGKGNKAENAVGQIGGK
jgi:hypothetical protein